MKRAKPKTGRKGPENAPSNIAGPRRPVDLGEIRQKIRDLVGGRAVEMVETTISEAENGHHAAMKYLFEMIGLYPATAQTETPGMDSLAKTLLRHLGLPEGPGSETEVTKDCQVESVADPGDAVK